MTDMRNQALKSGGTLIGILSRKCLAEKSMSKSTADQIIDPLENMDWPQKKKVADELIIILETSKTEEEILCRAEEMYENLSKK